MSQRIMLSTQSVVYPMLNTKGDDSPLEIKNKNTKENKPKI